MGKNAVIRRLLLSLLLLVPASAWAQTAYIAFGDSITAGVYDDDSRTELGYPPRLEALLQGAGIDAVVENYGKGGEDTGQALERINSVLNEAALSGDVLILMEGTNDISRGIPPETTRFHLNDMAERAERRGMTVIHATAIPRLPDARFDAQNITNTWLNQHIRDMAGRRERKLADPYELFSVIPDLFTRYYYQGNDDPVGHPIAAGYDLLAQIFFDVIRDLDRVPPVLGMSEPAHGDKDVSPTAPIVVEVRDFGAGIDLTATILVVDGVATTAPPVGDSKHVTFNYQPPAPLTGIVSVGLRSRDLATTPNTVDRELLSFTVEGAQILTGDMDQDGRVDGTDLLRFARRFGSRLGETLYTPSADFNNDQIIDGQEPGGAGFELREDELGPHASWRSSHSTSRTRRPYPVSSTSPRARATCHSRSARSPRCPAEPSPFQVRIALEKTHRAPLGDLQHLGKVRLGSGWLTSEPPQGGAGQEATGDDLLDILPAAGPPRRGPGAPRPWRNPLPHPCRERPDGGPSGPSRDGLGPGSGGRGRCRGETPAPEPTPASAPPAPVPPGTPRGIAAPPPVPRRDRPERTRPPAPHGSAADRSSDSPEASRAGGTQAATPPESTSASRKASALSSQRPAWCKASASVVRLSILRTSSPLRLARSTLCFPKTTARSTSPRLRVSALRLPARMAAFIQASWAIPVSRAACIGSTASARRPRARRRKPAAFRRNA